MRIGRRLDWLEGELAEVQVLADMGTDTVRAEIKLRKAMRQMVEYGVFKTPSPHNEQFAAHASLLLGRLVRLRGKYSEGEAWIKRAEAIYGSLVQSGTIRNLDMALRCVESLVLIEKDRALTKLAAGANLDLRGSELAVNRQLALVQSNLPIRDLDDHTLEYLQRRAELINLEAGAEETLEFLQASRFNALMNERPEHNHVLRLLYLCEVHTAAGDLDEAIWLADAAASFEIVARSSFLQIMLSERRIAVARRIGDSRAADGYEKIVRRLREIENINERPNIGEGADGGSTAS